MKYPGTCRIQLSGWEVLYLDSYALQYYGESFYRRLEDSETMGGSTAFRDWTSSRIRHACAALRTTQAAEASRLSEVARDSAVQKAAASIDQRQGTRQACSLFIFLLKLCVSWNRISGLNQQACYLPFILTC